MIPPRRRSGPRMLARLIVVGVVLLLAPTAPGQEKEASSVEEALARLATVLEGDQTLAAETKAALGGLVHALQAERAEARRSSPTTAPAINKGEIAKVVDEYLSAKPPTQERSALDQAFERLGIYGDLRLRHETDSGVDHRDDRNRERVRARIGVNYQINDELVVGGRIITGNRDDPQSPHQTLGNVFDSFEISLDRAFVTYRPQWAEGAWLTAGKFAHPFIQNPVYPELVWDADVQPEGVAVGYTFRDLGFLDRLDIVAGQYILLQQGRLDEASTFVAQISGQKALTDDLNLSGGVGWYRYTSLSPDGSLAVLGDNAGNAIAGDDFLSRFSIVNPIVALTYRGFPKPLTASGELIVNTRAARSDGTGWAAGIAYGETRNAKDWRVYFQYQDLERDAVVSALSQDDFTFGTNFRGPVFGAQYQITDNIGVHAWALLAERVSDSSFFSSDAGDDQFRFRLDLNIRF